MIHPLHCWRHQRWFISGGESSGGISCTLWMKFGFTCTVGDKNNAYYKRKPLKVLCAKPIWIDEALWSNPNRPNQIFLIETLDANPTRCSPEYKCMQTKGNILYFICRSPITTALLCVPALNNENALQLQCRWCQQQRGGLSLPCETVRLIRTCRWNLLHSMNEIRLYCWR